MNQAYNRHSGEPTNILTYKDNNFLGMAHVNSRMISSTQFDSLNQSSNAQRKATDLNNTNNFSEVNNFSRMMDETSHSKVNQMEFGVARALASHDFFNESNMAPRVINTTNQKF